MGIYCCQMIRPNETIQNEGTVVCDVTELGECIDQIGIFDKSCLIYLLKKSFTSKGNLFESKFWMF